MMLTYGPPMPRTGPCKPAGTEEIGAGIPRPEREEIQHLETM
jgi:hypothetical protein